jgi:hypothetical protein
MGGEVVKEHFELVSSGGKERGLFIQWVKLTLLVGISPDNNINSLMGKMLMIGLVNLQFTLREQSHRKRLDKGLLFLFKGDFQK